MQFRTVVITKRAKLEYRLGYLIIRSHEERSIYLAEISTLILASTAISLTAVLLNELVRAKTKVIFCDEKGSPHSEVSPYYGSYNNSKRIKKQITWKDEIKGQVWQYIIKEKITASASVLCDYGHTDKSKMLEEYASQVQHYDSTNREGHSAKVYFNSLFGLGFGRGQDNFTNGALNYGYAILLSAFNREIVACGYLTQLGIFHKNEYNNFNLSCDLMEPFRSIVDRLVLRIVSYDDFKKPLLNLLNISVRIDDKSTTLDVAIRQYVRFVIDALNDEDVSGIKFLQSYEL